MIHRVFSSLSSFKHLDLHSGLNILLSEKSPGATELDTRNRAGKSSLVELIHFVCGANSDPDSTFRAQELFDASFGLELDLFGGRVQASRSASNASKIVIEQGETTHWPSEPTRERDSSRRLITNSAWRRVLGASFFGLSEVTDDDEEEGTARPTFRSLFSYFARREASGGMRNATKNNDQQKLGDMQIATCFLIGIDWSIARQWEAVRQKEKHIRELKRIVGLGLLSDVLESAASLRSRLVIANEGLRRLEGMLSSFRVHEQYHGLEREASELTRRLGDLSDGNELDLTYVRELDAAMQSEAPPEPADLTRLYEEAGVTLPDFVRRRYDDVLRFHESVIRNRRSYLQSEHTAASERIRARSTEREPLDRRRAELMLILKSHGALDHFTQLQSEHSRLQAEANTLRHRYEAATQLEATNTALATDRVRLVERLRQEFAERSDLIDEAIRTFSTIVERLYGEPGRLVFEPTSNGPELRIEIPGDRSRGINNMEIFCFDMTVQIMCKRQGIGPRFLVHDSHLFDGVDPRQTGRALAEGARLADEIGFQYLVTLNSDVLSELPEDFSARDYVLPQSLTDVTATGGLFGIRFEPPRVSSSQGEMRGRGRASGRAAAQAPPRRRPSRGSS